MVCKPLVWGSCVEVMNVSLYPSRDGVEGVMGAKVADGVDGCIREVRRQVGVGSDWIKVPVYVPLLCIVRGFKRSLENADSRFTLVSLVHPGYLNMYSKK
jgi:hypothetical protein